MVGLVSDNENNINSIEDIIQSGEELILVSTSVRDRIYFEQEVAKIDDQELRYKFNKILDKIQIFHQKNFFEVSDKPELVKEFTERSVVLEDEYSMRWLSVSFSFENMCKLLSNVSMF